MQGAWCSPAGMWPVLSLGSDKILTQDSLHLCCPQSPGKILLAVLHKGKASLEEGMTPMRDQAAQGTTSP